MAWIRQIFLESHSEESAEIDKLAEWCIDDDLSQSLWLSSDDAYNLLVKDIDSVSDVGLDDVIQKSEQFPVKFPIETVRCKNLQNCVPKEILERNINSAYPVVHEKILQVIVQYLLYKSGPGGNKIEHQVYSGMDIPSFIDRLLTKRPATFVGPHDIYLLQNGVHGSGKWETIGTDNETFPLVLEHYLSYDEIKISALLSVSSYTYYLNAGDRLNKGLHSEDRDSIEEEGIIIGLVGPRFQRHNTMDHQDIIYDAQDKEKNIFLDMYGEKRIKYNILAKKKSTTTNRFLEYRRGVFFDNFVYAKRIALSFDTLLHEANARAKEKGTSAFVHVVGIGLGVWRILEHQNQLFLDVCARRIEYIGKYLQNVSDICFAYIKAEEANKFKHGDVIPINGHPKGGIKIHIVNRNPHEKLKGENDGKLLVVSFAWDGNALPGNEFWSGSLHTSSDPAAASSTQIAELHNSKVNPKVCGKNLRIVTNTGILTLKEYQEKVKQFKYDMMGSSL